MNGKDCNYITHTTCFFVLTSNICGLKGKVFHIKVSGHKFNIYTWCHFQTFSYSQQNGPFLKPYMIMMVRVFMYHFTLQISIILVYQVLTETRNKFLCGRIVTLVLVSQSLVWQHLIWWVYYLMSFIWQIDIKNQTAFSLFFICSWNAP